MHIKYNNISIKKNQFLFNIFIDISNLIIILMKIFEKTMA